MDITVIGASAGVGLETVHAALARGHRVTTLSRSVDALPASENLTVVQGTATSVDDVRLATVDADAILVTLGTKKPGTTTLFSDAASALIEAMAGREEPVIVVTGFGTGDSAQFQDPVARAFMKALLGRMYADKSRMEDILTATSLQWEIVRPGTLSKHQHRRHDDRDHLIPQRNESAGDQPEEPRRLLGRRGRGTTLPAPDRPPHRPPLATDISGAARPPSGRVSDVTVSPRADL